MRSGWRPTCSAPARRSFSPAGSTLGVAAALLAAVPPGETVALPRNIHRSVVAGLVLSGARPRFMPHDVLPECGALGVSRRGSWPARWTRSRKPAAVLLTRPSYYGLARDLADVVALCRARGVPLIVDEAHGGHFAFPAARARPKPALGGRAPDLVVQSCHKTLGSLVGSAHAARRPRVAGRAGRRSATRSISSKPPAPATCCWRRSTWCGGGCGARDASCSPRPSTKRTRLERPDRPAAGPAGAAAGRRSAAGRASAGSAAAGRQRERHRLERLRSGTVSAHRVSASKTKWPIGSSVVYILSPQDDPAARERLAGGAASRSATRQNRGRGRPGSPTRTATRLDAAADSAVGDAAPRKRPWPTKTIDSAGGGRWPDVCRNGYVLSTGHTALDARRNDHRGNDRRLPATAGGRGPSLCERHVVGRRVSVSSDSESTGSCDGKRDVIDHLRPRSQRRPQPSACPFPGISIPTILEIERRELFAAGPTYAGHLSLVPRDGDYAVRGGQQAGKLLVRHQGEAQLVSNVCRHRQAQLLTGSRPREEHRLPGPQLGLRPRRPAGCRAPFRGESLPRFGADRACRMERPAVHRPARRSPRAGAARRLDRAWLAATSCWSASTRKSTT